MARDKAVEKRKSTLPLDFRLRDELKKRGARIPSYRSIVYYCISCAKHRKQNKLSYRIHFLFLTSFDEMMVLESVF
jgi:ribosomal protein S26